MTWEEKIVVANLVNEQLAKFGLFAVPTDKGMIVTNPGFEGDKARTKPLLYFMLTRTRKFVWSDVSDWFMDHGDIDEHVEWEELVKESGLAIDLAEMAVRTVPDPV